MKSGDGLEVGLKALRVLGTELAANATWATNDNRDLELPARGVVEHPTVIGDLIIGEEKETHVHAFDDRAEARHGGANAHASEGVFGDWSVKDTEVSILRCEAFRHFV